MLVISYKIMFCGNTGFSVMYNNIRNGRRLSSFNAFLQPIRDNPNLTIYKFSEVTKVRIIHFYNTACG